MKIGIIGLGSIGIRHARCLKQLGYEDITALRTRKGAKELPKDLKFIKEDFNSNDFYSRNLDGIIISNPTSLHIKALKTPLEKKMPVFVEKPLADSLIQIKQIKNLNVFNIMVGYCFRYNKIINFVKEFVDKGKLGKVYKANLYCGQFLPSWHPYADYRKEYYSRKDLGGGAIRTLSHEIDLSYYFFGKAKELVAVIEKISDLEIDVDDNAYIILKNWNNVTITIELDFLNPLLTRRGTIFGSKGMLEYSFSKLNVTLTNYSGKRMILYKNPSMEINDMYISQMKAFINFIKDRENNQCSFDDGLNVMKVVKAAEKSMKNKSWQTVG